MQQIEVADNFPVPIPYQQKFEAAGLGTYLINYHKKKPMTYAQFLNATKNYGNCTEDEFWHNVKKETGKQITPIYGNDNAMSLMTGSSDVWNLSKITEKESLIHATDMKIPGVLSPYLYNGSGYTCFPWHIEDIYASSINILHNGLPKSWYIIPHSEAGKFESFSKKATKTSECNFLLRHKIVLIPPSVLKMNDIKFGRVSNFHGSFYFIFIIQFGKEQEQKQK